MSLPAGITLVCDATHANISSIPGGILAAGYVTGSPGIAWTAQDWSAHPKAVRIDQSPVSTAADETADVLDFEAGAATTATVVPWFRAALANYQQGKRPGQRHPVIYASQNNLTAVANALVAGGITANGPGLWVANWSLSEVNALALVKAASGPYPIVGVQFASGATYDTSVFSTTWLDAVSAAPAPPPPPPPPPHPVLLGIVSYIQQGLTANASDLAGKRVTSADGGATWK